GYAQGRSSRGGVPFPKTREDVTVSGIRRPRTRPPAVWRKTLVASIEYVDVRKGMVLVGDDGQLYQCLDRDLNTPGNWRAILQLKLKNLKTGSIAMQRVRPQDKVEVAYLEKKDFQYLYQEGDDYIFMDAETYDQA